MRGDAGRGSGYPLPRPGAAATISQRKVSPARGAALLQQTGKTSHNPLGKANRHEFAPPHGEQNLAVSE